jgi:hypothetical protein
MKLYEEVEVELHMAIGSQVQISAILLPEADWTAHPVLILRRSNYALFLAANTFQIKYDR